MTPFQILDFYSILKEMKLYNQYVFEMESQMIFNKILAFFGKPNKIEKKEEQIPPAKPVQQKRRVEPTRIGELGEYKINIQLDQLPKEIRYLSDVLIKNPKSKTGYSQIDHIVITEYGLFVIETKNYYGEIKGNRNDKFWNVSNRFKMYNPLFQNYGHIKVLESILSEFKNLKFVSMISFTMRCRFGVEPELRKIHSNQLIVYDIELSEYIERKLRWFKTQFQNPLLSESDRIRIYELIRNVNITDSTIRAEHNRKTKEG